VIDIVNGKVNSIMRLVLALAAHYKPNSVREARHRSSLASYAQVLILSKVFSDVLKCHLFFCYMNIFASHILILLIYILFVTPVYIDCDSNDWDFKFWHLPFYMSVV